MTELSVRVFPENVEAALDLMAEIVTTSRFSDLEVERRVILEELADEVDEDGRIIDVDAIAKSTLWPTASLGFGIAGPPENVRRFTVADLEKHRDRFYVASNAVLAVAGPVDPSRVLDAARRAFGAMPAGTPSIEAASSPERPLPYLELVRNSGSQTDLQLCFVAFPEADPDGLALQVLLRVLDDGVAARLQRRLCDDLGLAYHVGASLETYADTGLLLVEGSVRHEKVPTLLEEMGRLLVELVTDPLPAPELARARERYRWSLHQRLDSPESMGSWFVDGELFHVAEPLETRLLQANAVSAEDLRRVARRVFRAEGLLVTAVGHQGQKLQRRTREAFGRLCAALRAP
jgi:predicted Zn-dependent peptidase